jgi:hypothetical protein
MGEVHEYLISNTICSNKYTNTFPKAPPPPPNIIVDGHRFSKIIIFTVPSLTQIVNIVIINTVISHDIYQQHVTLYSPKCTPSNQNTTKLENLQFFM